MGSTDGLVAATLNMLIADGHLLVAMRTERKGQSVIDRMDEQFIAGPLALQGKDKGMARRGHTFEESNAHKSADVSAS